MNFSKKNENIIFAYKFFHYLCIPQNGADLKSFVHNGRCSSQYTLFSFARVAQLVEQLICNQLVGGSSPFSGSGKLNMRAGSRAAKWGGL